MTNHQDRRKPDRGFLVYLLFTVVFISWGLEAVITGDTITGLRLRYVDGDAAMVDGIMKIAFGVVFFAVGTLVTRYLRD